MLPSRSPLQSFATALLLVSGVLVGASGSFDAPIHAQDVPAEPEANTSSFQGQMSHSLGRTSKVSVSTGTSINASAEASMSPGYDAISISRVDLAPQSIDPITGLVDLDPNLPKLASRVQNTISSGTGVTSNTLSSSSLAAKSTSQDWINQARATANQAVGSTFIDYLTGVVNKGDTPNPEITDEASWQEQWDANYNSAYVNVLDSASDEDKQAVDQYIEEEQSSATGTVGTTGVSSNTSVGLSEGSSFSTVITPKGYAYDKEASLAKGAPVYSCQSVDCKYEVPVLSPQALADQLNSSHQAAKDKADADVASRVNAVFNDGYTADGKYAGVIENEMLDVQLDVPQLYTRDGLGDDPVYTPVTSMTLGQQEQVFILDAASGQYQEFSMPDSIYQLGDDGKYAKVDQVEVGGSYIDFTKSQLNYEQSKLEYRNSQNLMSELMSDDDRDEAAGLAYGNQYEPGRVYPKIYNSEQIIPSEKEYQIFRDRYYAHVNKLNYDTTYDSEYRQQVNSWLTQDERILADQQSGKGSAGVGVSTSMNVTSSNNSFEQAFIQAFN